MAIIDIFNGDADGICSLVQLRLADPQSSQLVTGVKRDISLVGKLDYAAGDEVTILDLSLDKNREGAEKALAAGAKVRYFDHHFAGNIPDSDRLEAHINPDSDICTSILVNQYLRGAYAGWAVVGAFGDNLKNSARNVAKGLTVSEQDLVLMEALGTYINYNGYGASLGDLHFDPAELYRRVVKFTSPFAFIDEDAETFNKLEQGYKDDMAAAEAITPDYQTDNVAVFHFPNKPWARRVSGVFSNDLVNAYPDRAHAVLTESANDTYLVSVRAPLNNKTGADDICRQFPTGGGRKAAAGINELPQDMLQLFIDTLAGYYSN